MRNKAIIISFVFIGLLGLARVATAEPFNSTVEFLILPCTCQCSGNQSACAQAASSCPCPSYPAPLANTPPSYDGSVFCAAFQGTGGQVFDPTGIFGVTPITASVPSEYCDVDNYCGTVYHSGGKVLCSTGFGTSSIPTIAGIDDLTIFSRYILLGGVACGGFGYASGVLPKTCCLYGFPTSYGVCPLPVTLNVTLAGSGFGTVISNDSKINCGADCSESYTPGLNSAIFLTATPDSNSVFSGWSGDADCSDGQVTMGEGKSCAANFASVNTPTYTVTPVNATKSVTAGAGTGASFYNSMQVATGTGGAGSITPLIASTPTPMSVLAAGGSAVATASYTFTGTAGIRSVRFCADYDINQNKTIPESDESNNCSPWTNVTVSSAASYSYTVNNLSFNAAQNGSLPVSKDITIDNTGSQPLTIGISESITWASINKSTVTIPAGGSDTVTVSISTTTLSPNTYTGTVDFTNAQGAGNKSSSITYVVSPSNSAPVASASISKDGSTYAGSITVTKGSITPIYLSSAGSSDSNGWTDAINGVSNGGKCEWNSDFNQGAPTYETTVNNPASATACNISLGDKIFNDAPGTYTYNVLKVTDKLGLASNIAQVQVTVQAGSCPAGSVILSASSINVGQTSTSSAPSGFSGGTFSSSSTTVATINSGTGVATGASFGSSNISGAGWTYASNGATGCSLTATALTVSSATSDPPDGPPEVKNTLSDAAVACENVKLTWTDQSDDETGFKIFMDGSLIYTTAANITQYTYTTLDNNLHNYSIASTNAAGNSALVPASQNPIPSIACNHANLDGSSKVLTKVNGAVFNPSTSSLKKGDKIEFTITLSNNGTASSTDIFITDAFTNLKIPSGGLNAKYRIGALDVPITDNGTDTSGHYLVTGGSEPNQIVKFNLTGSTFQVPAGGFRTLTFEAEIATQAGYTGLNSRLQNIGIINYTGYTGGISTTKTVPTPLYIFLANDSSPVIREVPAGN
jgi:hypothetical protein